MSHFLFTRQREKSRRKKSYSTRSGNLRKQSARSFFVYIFDRERDLRDSLFFFSGFLCLIVSHRFRGFFSSEPCFFCFASLCRTRAQSRFFSSHGLSLLTLPFINDWMDGRMDGIPFWENQWSRRFCVSLLFISCVDGGGLGGALSCWGNRAGFGDSRFGVGRIEKKRWIRGVEWHFDLPHYHCCLTVRLIECNDGSALDSWLPNA